jgi:ADP-heptose:LPS heptosyltransferase
MATEPQKILVIKLSALGDFLLTSGVFQAIRAHHPQAHITLLTTRLFVDMATRSGWFDAVEVDTRPPFYQLGAWLKLYKFLNGAGFDCVYDLQLNDRTRMIQRLFRRKPEWRGRRLREEEKSGNAVERLGRMMQDYGIDAGYPDLSWMSADISFFAMQTPYILLVPGCAPQHPYKRWPAKYFGALALKLQRENYQVALLGTAAEQEAIGQIKLIAPEVLDLSGRTSFYDIATLARGAAAAVGNDTGPMHLIALSGCPVVSLFSGVTDPSVCAPAGDRVTVIQSENIADISVGDVMKNLHPRDLRQDAAKASSHDV